MLACAQCSASSHPSAVGATVASPAVVAWRLAAVQLCSRLLMVPFHARRQWKHANAQQARALNPVWWRRGKHGVTAPQLVAKVCEPVFASSSHLLNMVVSAQRSPKALLAESAVVQCHARSRLGACGPPATNLVAVAARRAA